MKSTYLRAGAVLAALFLIAPPTAQGQDGPVGTVVGIVFDSTTAEPLANATVAVMGTTATGQTNEDGEFRLDDVPAGSHIITFFHTRLGQLGVGGSSQRVEVGEGRIAEVALSVPSRGTLLSAWCSAEPGAGPTSVGGTVTDVLTGVPLPGVRIGVLGDRSGVLQRREVLDQVQTDASGEFRVCNVAGGQVTVQAIFGENRAEPVEIMQDGIHVVDIAMQISEPVTIRGTVLDYATRAPIVGAQVQLVGSEFQATTDTVGQFGMTGVPPGRQVIQVDQLGYASRVDSLTVFSNEALGLEITLATEAIVLEPIVVTGRSRGLNILTTPGTRFSGLTEAQIDSIAPRVFDFASLARAARVPGISITEVAMADGFGGQTIGVCIEMLRQRSSSDPNTCNMIEVRLNDAPL
ncbi:MAG: hypothetical protein HKO53_16170, partial [Gemmatimonadetes bacterium]|nr:hypothetical protein [Gemmatimonadota bacterium]